MADQPHFAVVGGSIWGNRGAEAMLLTTIAQIRKVAPEALFNVCTIYPDRDRLLVSEENIHFLSGKPLAFGLLYFPFSLLHKLFSFLGISFPLPSSLKKMKDSCCLLDMGGITFSDGRKLQLLYNVFSIWPALLLGVPVIKLSQAMGPFERVLNRNLANHFLPKCKMIFARGAITEGHLVSLNLPRGSFRRAADIAFLYQPTDSLSVENQERVARILTKLERIQESGRRVISIIPSSLVFQQSKSGEGDYGTKLLNIIRGVCQERAHVVVLPNASRAGSGKVMNNDLTAIDALRERAAAELPPEVVSQVTWVDFDINARSIRALVGKTDALVTSRFHGMVAGLALCVPTMVIGWSHKYRETLADFDMASYAINYEAGLEETLALFLDFWQDNAKIRSLLEKRLGEVQASASQQFNYLREEIIHGN